MATSYYELRKKLKNLDAALRELQKYEQRLSIVMDWIKKQHGGVPKDLAKKMKDAEATPAVPKKPTALSIPEIKVEPEDEEEETDSQTESESDPETSESDEDAPSPMHMDEYLEPSLHTPNSEQPPTKKDLERCSYCSKQFSSKNAFTDHLQKSHNISSAAILNRCEICNQSFKSSKEFNVHVQQVHTKVKAPVEKRSSYDCATCGKSFKTNSDVRRHALTAHPDESEARMCSICGKTFKSQRRLTEHVNRSHPDPSLACKCDTCGKEFTSTKRLRYHKSRVHVESSFLCQLCGTALKTKEGLRTHTRSFHMEAAAPRPHLCTYCPATFRNKGDLGRHVNRHLGKDMSECPHCGVKKNKADLFNHINIVHKGRRFKCPYCASTFCLRAHLKNHLRLKHAGLPIPPDSDFDVIFTGNFEGHVKGGPPLRKRKPLGRKLACTKCEARFGHKPQLKLHMMKHENDPSYNFNPRMLVTRLHVEDQPEESEEQVIQITPHSISFDDILN